jgi:hypothetical protein
VVGRWLWSIVGMILTGEDGSTWWKTYLSPTLSTVNPTLTGLGSNLWLRTERPATNHLSSGMAHKDLLYMYTVNWNKTHSSGNSYVLSLIYPTVWIDRGCAWNFGLHPLFEAWKTYVSEDGERGERTVSMLERPALTHWTWVHARIFFELGATSSTQNFSHDCGCIPPSESFKI